jgi:hypothetical protein
MGSLWFSLSFPLKKRFRSVCQNVDLTVPVLGKQCVTGISLDEMVILSQRISSVPG